MMKNPDFIELLKNSLEGIADGMAFTVLRTSRSSVVRQSLDFSTGILDRSGQLIGQGMGNPGHLGVMPQALQACRARYEGAIEPGDILANNDPYEGASHLPDFYLFKPVFANRELVAFVCAMCHLADIGGRVAGGNASDSTEIYQEGLRIPPLKLYRREKPDEALFRIIEKAVRVPGKVLGDVQSLVAALNYGEREYVAFVKRLGSAELQRRTDELLEYTEAATRRAIQRIPDGVATFADFIDDDGFTPERISIVVTLTKRGDEIHFDFSGTSPQVRGAINAPPGDTRAKAYGVVKSILGQDIPNTAGYFRPITFTIPQGTILNPLPPAPVAARILCTMRVASAIIGAFAQLLPDQVYACPGGCEFGAPMAGYDKTVTPWRPWVLQEFHVDQAEGGRKGRDGFDAHRSGLINLANMPVEVIEAEHPIQVREYALAQGTEGAGEFRGGLGMVREFRFLSDETMLQVRADRMKCAPFGLYGGEPSSKTRIAMMSESKWKDMPSKFLVTANRGDVLRVEWPGGGGWGDPLNRDPRRVLHDVREGKVSADRARRTYGVVLSADARVVDSNATAEFRGALRARSTNTGEPV